ncbi:MAG: hypothetical protein M1840_003233 [Geoglossum simile]|nr:MAG: hypothetical protein M1840_003233 [Geoglossum simile]
MSTELCRLRAELAEKNCQLQEEQQRRKEADLVVAEKNCQTLERETIETPVAHIIDHLHFLDDVRNKFQLIGNGVTFYNYVNSMSDAFEKVIHRMQQHTLQLSTPQQHFQPSIQPTLFSITLKPDQVCIYCIFKDNIPVRKLALFVEYKLPHKVISDILKLDFCNMNLDNIINCQEIPTSDASHFRYHVDQIATSIATQTFCYMIQNIILYGYITTGQAFVFLHICSDNPTMLFYYLSEPQTDVAV